MSNQEPQSPGPQSPGIVFPPPLLFALIGFGGWFAARYYPALQFDVLLWLQFVGTLMAFAGLGLEFWTLGLFKRAKTSALPWQGDQALVATGAYKVSRNPMYAGMLLLVIGLCLGLGLILSLILIPLGALIIDRVVIRAEERYLAARFGDAYLDYCKTVRRWL